MKTKTKNGAGFTRPNFWKKNLGGFTLIEIMVVISIIILLSVITLANYRLGAKHFALERSVHKLSQDLRKAEEMAIASQEFQGAFQGGYGIYFPLTPVNEDTGFYTLFVDCDDDNEFDEIFLTCADCTGASCVSGVFSEKVEKISLEKGIYLSELSPSSPENWLIVKFFPPDPKTTFKPDANLASLTLTFDGKTKKEVKINKAGLIEIE